jgi:phospholipase C
LTSVFQPYNGENIPLPNFVEKEPFIQAVHQAQFKELPSGYKVLTEAEQEAINQNPQVAKWMPQQEKGIRPACAIPYELYVDGQVKGDVFELKMKAGTTVFGKKTKGSPFKAYSTIPYLKKDAEGKSLGYESMLARDYAIKAGDQLNDTWKLSESESGQYAVDVYAPNGFFRTFKGNASDSLKTSLTYESASKSHALTGNVVLNLENISKTAIVIEVIDESYETGLKTINLTAGQSQKLVLNLTKSHNWYDFSVKVKDDSIFLRRYAGHVETGQSSFTDPAMGLVKTA